MREPSGGASYRAFYVSLSHFQDELTDGLNNAQGWRDNAVQLTRRYLEEGLQDRAATRDLTWGVDVPIPGFEDKKIYVWIEAVSGYLSASKQWAAETGGDWESFWLKGRMRLRLTMFMGRIIFRFIR